MRSGDLGRRRSLWWPRSARSGVSDAVRLRGRGGDRSGQPTSSRSPGSFDAGREFAKQYSEMLRRTFHRAVPVDLGAAHGRQRNDDKDVIKRSTAANTSPDVDDQSFGVDNVGRSSADSGGLARTSARELQGGQRIDISQSPAGGAAYTTTTASQCALPVPVRRLRPVLQHRHVPGGRDRRARRRRYRRARRRREEAHAVQPRRLDQGRGLRPAGDLLRERALRSTGRTCWERSTTTTNGQVDVRVRPALGQGS